MKRIGITGGIGSGKSYIAAVLVKMGYPVFNSDIRAKELTNTHPEIIQGLKARFGEHIYEDQQVNKTALSAKIFSSEEDRLFVNGLIHPLVREDFNAWCMQQRGNVVFKEAAILFETGSYKELDATVLVTAPYALKIHRIKERDGSSEAQARSRMDHQWSDAQKTPLADFVIKNDERTPILQQLEEMLATIIS